MKNRFDENKVKNSQFCQNKKSTHLTFFLE